MRSFGVKLKSAWVLAVMTSLWGLSCEADQISAGIGVNITLQTSGGGVPGGVPDGGTCTYLSTFGTAVRVSCSPGDLRFLTPSVQTEPLLLISPVQVEWPLTRKLDASWRKIMVDNQEYFEIMVRW